MADVISSYIASNFTGAAPLILGGSRGLGRSIFESFGGQVVSRKQGLKIDLCQEGAVTEVVNWVCEHQPSYVFYVAGGGPHGAFFKFQEKDHDWAFRLNYWTPRQIFLDLKTKSYSGEFIYIGSAIALRSESLSSLSYNLSKRAATAFFLSQGARVFSPAYMDTNLLPKRAWPRKLCPELVVAPDKVADVMQKWLKDAEPFRLSNLRHFDWMEAFEYSLPKGKEI